MNRKAMSDSVTNMIAAVAALDATRARVAPVGAARAELAGWVAKQRAAREAAGMPLVSSVAPRSALEAWRVESAKRHIRGA